MCLAIPGQIKSIKGRGAEVDYDGSVRKALIGEEKVKVGNWVMVQMGIIVKKMSATEAKEMLNVWKEVGGL
jgi:hydrogenase assembly chaperone HypC/HupF